MSSPAIREALQQAVATMDDGIVCVYLFGSQGRGDADKNSDVDVAVLFERTPPATFDGLRLDIGGMLEARLRRPVDLVILNHAPADLVHRVLRDGVLIVERDRAARIRFEVKARNEYFDLAPVRARYRAGADGRVV